MMNKIEQDEHLSMKVVSNLGFHSLSIHPAVWSLPSTGVSLMLSFLCVVRLIKVYFCKMFLEVNKYSIVLSFRLEDS